MGDGPTRLRFFAGARVAAEKPSSVTMMRKRRTRKLLPRLVEPQRETVKKYANREISSSFFDVTPMTCGLCRAYSRERAFEETAEM